LIGRLHFAPASTTEYLLQSPAMSLWRVQAFWAGIVWSDQKIALQGIESGL